MFEAWSFSTELPMLIADRDWRLCYRNPTLEQTYPGLLKNRRGTPLTELALPFINEAVLAAAHRLEKEVTHEGMMVPVPECGHTVLVFLFSTLPDRSYIGVMVMENAETIVEPTPVDSLFDMMNRAYRSTDEDDQALSEQDQHLIQSEKMAAIGQLSAGVAHEINNPIGYICSNLNSLGDYVDKLIKLLDSLETVQNVEDMRRLRDQLDYDYIKSDIMDCIEESAEGANRVRDIIAALKDFSHSDDGALSRYPLRDAFETTLKLVTNEVKYNCTVHQSLADVPDVECSANQIKQVIMNLIVNAAHAIRNQGNIWLRMDQQGPWVWFEVEDDGVGIPNDKISRIFEPFFTTKPVGKGTGLGLSLSYSIIQRHQGRIEVMSKEGEGTRFRVWLPIEQAENPPVF